MIEQQFFDDFLEQFVSLQSQTAPLPFSRFPPPPSLYESQSPPRVIAFRLHPSSWLTPEPDNNCSGSDRASRSVSGFSGLMGTERKRKVSLFDVVGDTSAPARIRKSNGALSDGSSNGSSLVNRWNGRAYSTRYYEILEKRKSLPVWQQKDEFLQVLKENQTLILVGETGSGKTTQVGFCLLRWIAAINPCPWVLLYIRLSRSIVVSSEIINGVRFLWFLRIVSLGLFGSRNYSRVSKTLAFCPMPVFHFQYAIVHGVWNISLSGTLQGFSASTCYSHY